MPEFKHNNCEIPRIGGAVWKRKPSLRHNRRRSDSLSDKKYMAYKIFSEIAECLLRLFRSLYEKNYHMIILAGGVSQSEFLRKKLLKNRKETLIRPVFGSYGGDNGVGISLLTMKKEIKTV